MKDRQREELHEGGRGRMYIERKRAIRWVSQKLMASVGPGGMGRGGCVLRTGSW